MAYYFASFLSELYFCVFLAFITYYLYFKFFSSKYWKNRNVFHLEPIFLLGNLWKSLYGENIWILISKLHQKLKREKLIGIWNFTTPYLVVTDLELIKNILIKDVHHFQNHGLEINVEREPLAGHLFNLTGTKWRNLRVKLTPTFTSGKIKLMFPIMVQSGQQLQNYMNEVMMNENSIEIKDIMARFTTDIISSCAFGIEANSMKNPDSEFRKYGRKIFELNLSRKFIVLFFNSFPKLFNLLGFRAIQTDVSDFFLNAVQETMEYREKNSVQRNDFLQLLIQLKNKGKLDEVDKTEVTPEETNGNTEHIAEDMKFTFIEAAAQAFVFFIAGFETSSTTLTFALYELAINPDVQKTLQSEIDRVLEKYDQKFTYEGFAEMHYLDWIVHETLRKYPPVPALIRECTKDYEIPEMNVTIEKGTKVFISTFAIQRDPDYFPDPEKFDPSRHSPEEKAKRENITSLYFGEGPRVCIGNRFGLLQVKIGLASLLSQYNVLPSKNTPTAPLKFEIASFILATKGVMQLKFEKR